MFLILLGYLLCSVRSDTAKVRILEEKWSQINRKYCTHVVYVRYGCVYVR